MSKYRFKHNELYNKYTNETIGYLNKTSNIFYGDKKFNFSVKKLQDIFPMVKLFQFTDDIDSRELNKYCGKNTTNPNHGECHIDGKYGTEYCTKKKLEENKENVNYKCVKNPTLDINFNPLDENYFHDFRLLNDVFKFLKQTIKFQNKIYVSEYIQKINNKYYMSNTSLNNLNNIKIKLRSNENKKYIEKIDYQMNKMKRVLKKLDKRTNNLETIVYLLRYVFKGSIENIPILSKKNKHNAYKFEFILYYFLLCINFIQEYGIDTRLETRIQNEKLFQHQQEALEFIKKRKEKGNSSILVHRQGSGKTVTSTYFLLQDMLSQDKLKNNRTNNMIICSKNNIEQWYKKIVDSSIRKSKDPNDPYNFYELNYNIYKIQETTPEKRIKIINTIIRKRQTSTKHLIILTTYSQLLDNSAHIFLKNLDFRNIIIDEVQEFRNLINKYKETLNSNEISKMFHKVQMIKRGLQSKHKDTKDGTILALSATPEYNRNEDIISLLYCINALPNNRNLQSIKDEMNIINSTNKLVNQYNNNFKKNHIFNHYQTIFFEYTHPFIEEPDEKQRKEMNLPRRIIYNCEFKHEIPSIDTPERNLIMQKIQLEKKYLDKYKSLIQRQNTNEDKSGSAHSYMAKIKSMNSCGFFDSITDIQKDRVFLRFLKYLKNDEKNIDEKTIFNQFLSKTEIKRINLLIQFFNEYNIDINLDIQRLANHQNNNQTVDGYELKYNDVLKNINRKINENKQIDIKLKNKIMSNLRKQVVDLHDKTRKANIKLIVKHCWTFDINETYVYDDENIKKLLGDPHLNHILRFFKFNKKLQFAVDMILLNQSESKFNKNTNNEIKKNKEETVKTDIILRDNTINQNDKIIIASQFSRTLDILQAHPDLKDIMIQYPNQKNMERHEILDTFYDTKQIRVLGVTKGSCQTGIDLGISPDKKVKVFHMINIEPGDNIPAEEQLYARIIRSGMGVYNDSTIYNLRNTYTENSIQQVSYLFEKQMEQKNFNGDVYLVQRQIDKKNNEIPVNNTENETLSESEQKIVKYEYFEVMFSTFINNIFGNHEIRNFIINNLRNIFPNTDRLNKLVVEKEGTDGCHHLIKDETETKLVYCSYEHKHQDNDQYPRDFGCQSYSLYAYLHKKYDKENKFNINKTKILHEKIIEMYHKIIKDPTFVNYISNLDKDILNVLVNYLYTDHEIQLDKNIIIPGIRETLRLWEDYGIDNYLLLSKEGHDEIEKLKNPTQEEKKYK